jgi:ferredoxin
VQVTVDQDRCCSSGQCVLLAPAVFDQSEDDGVVQLLLPRPPEELHGAVRAAVGICPGRAISVQDA